MNWFCRTSILLQRFAKLKKINSYYPMGEVAEVTSYKADGSVDTTQAFTYGKDAFGEDAISEIATTDADGNSVSTTKFEITDTNSDVPMGEVAEVTSYKADGSVDTTQAFTYGKDAVGEDAISEIATTDADGNPGG